MGVTRFLMQGAALHQPPLHPVREMESVSQKKKPPRGRAPLAPKNKPNASIEAIPPSCTQLGWYPCDLIYVSALGP